MLNSQFQLEQPTTDFENVFLDLSARQTKLKNNVALHGPDDLVVTIHNSASLERIRLERFVKALFKRAYSADINYFMPELLALNKHDGTLLAVCGLRKANQEALFLERYLTSSIEDTISTIEKKVVSRDAITEIGNLAVARPQNIRFLLACINLYLHKTNTDWAVFTGIRSLKNALIKLNIPVLTLGSAQINCIPEEERGDWGSYYAEKPEVMAIKRIIQAR